MMRSKVDLPAPSGPKRVVFLPRSTLKERSSKRIFSPHDLWMNCTVNALSVIRFQGTGGFQVSGCLTMLTGVHRRNALDGKQANGQAHRSPEKDFPVRENITDRKSVV